MRPRVLRHGSPNRPAHRGGEEEPVTVGATERDRAFEEIFGMPLSPDAADEIALAHEELADKQAPRRSFDKLRPTLPAFKAERFRAAERALSEAQAWRRAYDREDIDRERIDRAKAELLADEESRRPFAEAVGVLVEFMPRVTAERFDLRRCVEGKDEEP
jgi:hypothetical protein